MQMTEPAIMNGFLQLRVESIRYAARDTYLVELVDPQGSNLPVCEPGAHIELFLANGISRSYSLVNAQGVPGPSYIVGVKKDPKSRGGSQFIHEQLRVGQILKVSSPRNHFPLVAGAAHSVLIAGGIGITPVWAMAQQLEQAGASWELWYSVRSRQDVCFPREIAALGSKVKVHCDDEAGTILDIPAIFAQAPEAAHFYCCGPTPMLDAYEAAGSTRPEGHVHLERFAAKQAPVTSSGTCVIKLAKSNRDIQVPAGVSILDALLQEGISVDFSCKEGICGCCEVAVLEGEVDHRDEVLTNAEKASNKTMMVCCSGAKNGCLTLDL